MRGCAEGMLAEGMSLVSALGGRQRAQRCVEKRAHDGGRVSARREQSVYAHVRLSRLEVQYFVADLDCLI